MTDEQDSRPEEVNATVSVVTDPVDTMRCEACDAKIDVSDLAAFTDIECPHCEHHSQVPAQFGHFRLLRLLGMGGMGGVFYAHDETLGRFVAIKVMLQSLGDDASFVETFKREAQAVAKLNHPNIAQIYSFGQEKGQPYIVMELVKGEHLDKMIEEEKLGQSLVLRVILEIANGLAEAAETGLIHGDIKPENILLDDKGHAKLVDFGLATFVDQQAQEGIWGTPYYIAPEKVRRRKTDARSDIYSLGATMFHALTGRPPFEGETPVEVVKARLTGPAPTVSSLREDIDPEIDRIVTRMLEEEPGRRYPTYASLIGDLNKTLERIGPDKTERSALRGKKLVIRKKGGKSRAGSQSKPTSGKIVVSRGSGRISSSTSVPPVDADTRRDHRTDEPPKPRGKGFLVALIVLLVLALIGGGTYWGMHAANQRKEEARRAAQQAALNALHQQGTTLYEEMKGADTRLAKAETAALAFYATANSNLLAVEEAPLVAPQPPPAPKAATTDAVAATNTSVEAAQPVPAPKPAGKTPVKTVSAIRGVAQRVVEACETIMRLRTEAAGLIAEAATLNETLQQTEESRAARSVIEQIERLHAQIPGLISKARAALKTARDDTAETSALREKEEARLEEARAAAEKAAREKAQREAEERARLQKQAKIAAELERAKMATKDVSSDVAVYNFMAAARTLKLAARDFETAEGKTAMANAVERYERLASMKQYFIDRLSQAPFPWGYVDGPSRVDILSANRAGIQIKSGLIPWREVSPRQIAELIKRYISEEALTQGVKLRELADQYVNAAIFCAINGWHSPAEVYSDAAVNLLSTTKDDVERLVPPPSADDAKE